MLKQLQEAEKELKRKQEDADQDMMMAGMVSGATHLPAGRERRAFLEKESFLRTSVFRCVFIVKNWVSNLHRRQRIWTSCQVLAQLSCPEAPHLKSKHCFAHLRFWDI